MLPDQLGHRQKVLASQLLAPKIAVDSLSECVASCPLIYIISYALSLSSLRPNPPRLVAGCPRIYSSFSHFIPGLAAEIDTRLTFHARIHEYPQSSLFLASVGDFESFYLVKLVNSGYGVAAHQTLAENYLAPQLFGFKHLDGAPSAYIMDPL
jgi:hypothetical protein